MLSLPVGLTNYRPSPLNILGVGRKSSLIYLGGELDFRRGISAFDLILIAQQNNYNDSKIVLSLFNIHSLHA